MARKDLREYLGSYQAEVLDSIDTLDVVDNIVGDSTVNSVMTTLTNSAYKLGLIREFLREEKKYADDDALKIHIRGTIDLLQESIVDEHEDTTRTSYALLGIDVYMSFLEYLNKGEFIRGFRKISDNTFVVPMKRSAITGKYI